VRDLRADAERVGDADGPVVDGAAPVDDAVGDLVVPRGILPGILPVGGQGLIPDQAGTRAIARRTSRADVRQALAPPADHDPVPADVAQLAAHDLVALTRDPQADATRAGVQDAAAFQPAVRGVGQLDRGRQNVDGALHVRAVMAGLNAQVAERRQRPLGVLERQALQPDVPHGRIGPTRDDNEPLQLRRDEPAGVGVLIRAGHVGQRPAGPVEIPFARLIDERQGVLDVDGLARAGGRGRTVADPSHRGRHGHGTALRGDDGHTRDRPVLIHHQLGVLASQVAAGQRLTQLDLFDVLRDAPDAEQVLSVGKTTAGQPDAVGEQLAESPRARFDVGQLDGPFPAARLLPALDDPPAADDDRLAGTGGVGDGMLVRAGVLGPERQRRVQQIRPAPDKDRDVLLEPLADERTNRVTCPHQRSERRLLRAGVGVVTVRGDVEVRLHGSGPQVQ